VTPIPSCSSESGTSSLKRCSEESTPCRIPENTENCEDSTPDNETHARTEAHELNTKTDNGLEYHLLGNDGVSPVRVPRNNAKIESLCKNKSRSIDTRHSNDSFNEYDILTYTPRVPVGDSSNYSHIELILKNHTNTLEN